MDSDLQEVARHRNIVRDSVLILYKALSASHIKDVSVATQYIASWQLRAVVSMARDPIFGNIHRKIADIIMNENKDT